VLEFPFLLLTQLENFLGLLTRSLNFLEDLPLVRVHFSYPVLYKCGIQFQLLALGRQFQHVEVETAFCVPAEVFAIYCTATSTTAVASSRIKASVFVDLVSFVQGHSATLVTSKGCMALLPGHTILVNVHIACAL